jgi:hypothetical protein
MAPVVGVVRTVLIVSIESKYTIFKAVEPGQGRTAGRAPLIRSKARPPWPKRYRTTLDVASDRLPGPRGFPQYGTPGRRPTRRETEWKKYPCTSVRAPTTGRRGLSPTVEAAW